MRLKRLRRRPRRAGGRGRWRRPRRERPAKGTGLGTRIVKAMAPTMGAEIEYLARQPGTAARLIFPLPAGVTYGSRRRMGRAECASVQAGRVLCSARGGDWSLALCLLGAGLDRWRQSRRTGRPASPCRRCSRRSIRTRRPAAPPPGLTEGAGLRAGQRARVHAGRRRGLAAAARDRGLDYRVALARNDGATMIEQVQALRADKVGRGGRRAGRSAVAGAAACRRSSGPAPMSARSCRRRRRRCSTRRST